jgi:hypothetical protein
MSSTSFSPPPGWYEPPEPGPECLWCDGAIDERTGYSYVDVGSIVDVSGNRHANFWEPPRTLCPRCDGTGVEPKPERED